MDYGNIPMECANRQNRIARLSHKKRAEPFFWSFAARVSFRRFLDRVQRALNNQFLLQFRAMHGGRAGLKPNLVGTGVPGVELISAHGVWVPAAHEDNPTLLRLR